MDANIKELENSMETHIIYLKASDILWQALIVNFQTLIYSNCFPMYATNVTHWYCLWPLKFTLEAVEGTVVSEVGILGLSHFSYIKVPLSKVKGSRKCCWTLFTDFISWNLKQHMPFAREIPFSFDSDQSVTQGW
jgi:hypothetical protein